MNCLHRFQSRPAVRVAIARDGSPADPDGARVRDLARTAALVAVAIVALTGVSPAHSAADDASNWVVIPWVDSGPATTTRVTLVNPVSNLISTPDVTFVPADAGSASPPGAVSCAKPTVLPLSSTSFDLRTACGLGTAAIDGTVHVRTRHQQGGVERLSATAVVEYLSRTFANTVEQRVAVEGIPMAAFPGNANDQMVDGLDEGPPGTSRTDCYVVTGLDGSGAGGAWVRLQLRDEQNAPIGNDVLFAARPFALRKVEDVFRQAGVSGTVRGGVRARVGFLGRDDHVLAYCKTQHQRNVLKQPGVSYHVALPLEPSGPTRGRATTADTDLVGAAFTVTGTESAAHALFVRHPDRLRCTVRSTSPSPLKVALRDPGLNWVVDNGMSDTGWVDVPLKSAVAAGTSDVWALHVEQVTPTSNTPIPYTVTCESGNGMSKPDQRFVFRTRPN